LDHFVPKLVLHMSDHLGFWSALHNKFSLVCGIHEISHHYR